MNDRIATLLRLLQSQPDDTDLRLELAGAYQTAGNAGQAAVEYAAAARVLTARGALQDAAAVCKLILDLDRRSGAAAELLRVVCGGHDPVAAQTARIIAGMHGISVPAAQVAAPLIAVPRESVVEGDEVIVLAAPKKAALPVPPALVAPAPPRRPTPMPSSPGVSINLPKPPTLPPESSRPVTPMPAPPPSEPPGGGLSTIDRLKEMARTRDVQPLQELPHELATAPSPRSQPAQPAARPLTFSMTTEMDLQQLVAQSVAAPAATPDWSGGGSQPIELDPDDLEMVEEEAPPPARELDTMEMQAAQAPPRTPATDPPRRASALRPTPLQSATTVAAPAPLPPPPRRAGALPPQPDATVAAPAPLPTQPRHTPLQSAATVAAPAPLPPPPRRAGPLSSQPEARVAAASPPRPEADGGPGASWVVEGSETPTPAAPLPALGAYQPQTTAVAPPTAELRAMARRPESTSVVDMAQLSDLRRQMQSEPPSQAVPVYREPLPAGQQPTAHPRRILNASTRLAEVAPTEPPREEPQPAPPTPPQPQPPQPTPAASAHQPTGLRNPRLPRTVHHARTVVASVHDKLASAARRQALEWDNHEATQITPFVAPPEWTDDALLGGDTEGPDLEGEEITPAEIANVPLLSGLPLSVTNGLLRPDYVRRRRAGAILMSDSHEVLGVYVILRGEVEARSSSGHRAPRTLRVGEFFGQDQYLTGHPPSVIVQATTDVALLLLPPEALARLGERDPDVWEALWRQVGAV